MSYNGNRASFTSNTYKLMMDLLGVSVTTSVSAEITGLADAEPQNTSGEGTTLHYWPSRIWRDANGNEVDKSPYGHIALQLSDRTYISYWPAGHLGPLDVGKEVEPSLHRKYFDDYDGEHQTDSETFTI